MAGLLDLHVVATLQGGWAYYGNSATAFRELFPRGVSDDVVDEWHAALAARVQPLTFHIFGKPGVRGGDEKKWPDIAVELQNEDPEQQRFLGDGGHVDATTRRRSAVLLIRQRVRIDVFSYQPETTRALHRAVVAILVTAQQAFQEAGYMSLDYDGTEPLTFEEQALAEDMGAFVTRVRFSASSKLELLLPEVALQEKAWWVHMQDIEVDGRPGGVVPFEPDS